VTVIEFGLLGPMIAIRDDVDVLPPPGKQRALLASLLLQRGDTVAAEQLMEALWGDPPPATARNALQGHISSLRKLLGSDRIETRAPGYVLHVSADELDVARFEQLVLEARAAGTAARRAELARRALALMRGEPLAEFRYDAFARAAIARLQELRLVAIEERLEAELELGHTELVAELEALVAAEPLRERLHGLLMLALYRAGRQAEALEVYRNAWKLLRDELGIDPGPKLQEINRAILAQDRSLAPERREIRLPRRGLPASPTRLVGRKVELESIESLLDSGARLVTITGVAGSGKTRVALEVARRVAERGENVAFVPLATLSTPELVASTIARVLGIDETPGEPVGETIEAAIGDTRLLLTADNLEHLLDGAPAFARLLENCPNLTLLATSRSPLRLTGEHAYPLDPLPLDEAVSLFEDRARAANPRLESDRAAASAICERLDCLPLALELAAARASLLALADVLTRLDHRFELLTVGTRDSPDRQRTLRNTIDWSHNLLDDDAKLLFARLAVFSGGWTIDSAEKICGASLALLDVLVDASLIRHREARFSMLETIREYALERLAEQSIEDETVSSHAAYFVELAERECDELEGPGQRAALARLDAELDNLRAALAWSHRAEPEWALRLAAALGRFWAMRGLFKEARQWLDSVLASGDLDSPTAAKAFLAAGNFAGYYEGDHERARDFLSRGLEVARATGRAEYVGRILSTLGRTARGQGDSETARTHYEEALVLQREVGDAEHVAVTLTNLGITILETGDVARAADLLAESVHVLREIGDDAMLAGALQSLAYAKQQLGAFDEARRLSREGLALARAVDDQPAMAWALVVAASVEAARAPARAADFLAAAETAYVRLGLAWDPLDVRLREEITRMVCGALGDAEMDAAREKGSQTGLDAAVTAALESTAVGATP
jgi:predicted ATPase/DNA-binding SARP family transcriptional activator